MYSVIGNSDTAHTVGNVTFILTEILHNLFPKNFFNYTHIATMMPYKEYIQNEDRMRQGFIKKRRPILAIRPRPIIMDDDIFMARSNLTSPVFSSINDPNRSNYNRFFRDDKNDITISYMMNRMRVQCQVLMLFDTMIEQINVYNLLRNMFIDNRPYWTRTALEVFIPRELIKYVSDISGVAIRDSQSGSVRKFLDYMMMNSNKYFTFKERNSTQSEEFFLYYPINLEYVFTDWNMDDVNKVNDVSDSANISFTLTAEFNTVGMFQLSTERDDTVLKANTVVTAEMNEGNIIRPYFTVDNLFAETNKKGWKLFFTNIFNTEEDVPVDEPDILSLSHLFNDSDLHEILEYHKKNGISNEVLFDFVIMKNNTRLNADKTKGKIDYVVDLDNERILIYNKNHLATYRILIYVNNLYIMTLMNTISDVEESYEKPLDKGDT